MTSVLTAWRGLSNPERFDTYTRWTVYLLLATEPFLMVGVAVGGAAETGGAAVVLASVAHTVVTVIVVHRALDRVLGGPRLPSRWALALVVTTLGTAGAALTLPPDARMLAVVVVLTFALMALAPALSVRLITLASVAIGVAAALLGESAAPAAVTAMLVFLVVVGVGVSFRISGWMLAVVWEQERARGVVARLAVAEERLRFSRDLHDVVGRTLSAVAVKSELAAELARRGQDGAAEQMLEVRALAQESLKEVRGVVAGYRSADLAAELTGARSVLRSAGVQTRVVGEGTDLPGAVQEALAWVVREAVTNVVRHSQAGTCIIDLMTTEIDGAPTARLEVTNDGGTGRRATTGTGLIGLTERLGAVGGTVTTSHDGDRFTLRATVPLAAPAVTREVR